MDSNTGSQDGPLERAGIVAEQRRAQDAIRAGKRPSYRVRAKRGDSGDYRVLVLELPSLRLTTSSRKGIEGVARQWLALLLELPEDAFDVVEARGVKYAGR